MSLIIVRLSGQNLVITEIRKSADHGLWHVSYPGDVPGASLRRAQTRAAGERQSSVPAAFLQRPWSNPCVHSIKVQHWDRGESSGVRSVFGIGRGMEDR